MCTNVKVGCTAMKEFPNRIEEEPRAANTPEYCSRNSPVVQPNS